MPDCPATTALCAALAAARDYGLTPRGAAAVEQLALIIADVIRTSPAAQADRVSAIARVMAAMEEAPK